MDIPTPRIVSFNRAITDYYYQSGRHDMPWRKPGKDGTFDPYAILVSEMMLQQTQVDRVMPKYAEFLAAFPTVQSLAGAPLSAVLTAWNGLGYNRRAKYIHDAAQRIVKEFNGAFPRTQEELQTIPGIGPNTAGAILAYAYNLPAIFVETNIRTVIIHAFFADQGEGVGAGKVHDRDIRAVLEKVVPPAKKTDDSRMHGAMLSPREFYWALMDYGTYLKKSVGNISKASSHYAKQSKFEGSLRQVRGQVIRLLTAAPGQSLQRKELETQVLDERLDSVIAALTKEGLVATEGSVLRLS